MTEQSPQEDEASLRLAAIVAACDDAIIGKTLDGIITSWNAAAERIFGYSAAEAIGQPISLIVPPECREQLAGIFETIRRGQRVEHLETVRLRKDGRRIDVSVTVSPIKDARGRIIGVSKVARDITPRKQAQRELKAAKEAAEAANHAKDEFLAVLSHELRTPLTPVLAAASALAADDSWPESLRQDVEMIRGNVAMEARLIDDLLDLTRLRQGRVEPGQELVNIHDALRAAVDVCRGELAIKSQQLELHLDAPSPLVRGDPARLQQVFWNLLTNASKFTPERGRITVRTRSGEVGSRQLAVGSERAEAAAAGCQPPTANSCLAIEISDTGIGIDPQHLPRLFKAFERGDHRHAPRFGGLGLGLAISRALVQIHGGSIEARSDGRNKGSTFTIKLPTSVGAGHAPPCPLAQVPSAMQERARHASPLRILLVEDHETSRRVLARLLTRLGHQVTVAPDMDTALREAAASTFDLLISDLGLPDGSGLDLMRRLHERKTRIKGICLSGLGMEEDQRRSREAGFMAHLTKPIAFQTLEAAIQRAAHCGADA